MGGTQTIPAVDKLRIATHKDGSFTALGQLTGIHINISHLWWSLLVLGDLDTNSAISPWLQEDSPHFLFVITTHTHCYTTFHINVPPDYWRDNPRSNLQDCRRWNRIQDWQFVRGLNRQLLQQCLNKGSLACEQAGWIDQLLHVLDPKGLRIRSMQWCEMPSSSFQHFLRSNNWMVLTFQVVSSNQDLNLAPHLTVCFPSAFLIH